MSRDGFIKGPRAEFCSIKSPLVDPLIKIKMPIPPYRLIF